MAAWAKSAPQVESGAVGWDVVDVEMQDAVRGCDDGLFRIPEGLQLPAAGDGTPASDDFLPGTLTDCGVGSIVWSTILAVRDDKFSGGKPTAVKDFFDLHNFPGKRGAMKKPQTLLEWALIADGVDNADVYAVLASEEGVTRAFAKLDTIKDEIVWWDSHAQAPQLLADGEVSMTMAANGRIFDAIQRQAALLDRLGSSDLEPGPLGHSQGIGACGGGQGIHRVRGGSCAACRPTKSTSPTARCGNRRRSWSMPPSLLSCRPPRRISGRRCRTISSSGRTTATSWNERFNVWLNL